MCTGSTVSYGTFKSSWSTANLWNCSRSTEVHGSQHREAKSCLKVFNLPKGAGYVVLSLREA